MSHCKNTYEEGVWIMISNVEKNNREIMYKVLNDIKAYVLVVGSVAEKTNNSSSDIDFYVKTKPEK